MTTVITFAFSLEQVEEFIALRKETSATQVDNFFYYTFKGPDNFYTYIFRLWRLVTHDLVEKNGGTFSLPSEGLIATVANKPVLAGLILLIMLGFSSLAAFYYCLKEQEKEKEQRKRAKKNYKNSSAQIGYWMSYKTTWKDSLSSVTNLPPKVEIDAKEEASKLNICLTKILNQPEYQSYANATIKIVKGYNLAPLPDLSVKLQARTIYLKDAKEYLAYKVIDQDNQLKEGTILWDKLPNIVPKTIENILDSNNAYLPHILPPILEAGHILENNKIFLTLGKKTQLSLVNISNASWKAGMQAGFIYWIGWIAAGCITGMLSVGIWGVAPWLAFGIPLFVGALPRLVQMWHWIKRYLEIDPQSSAPASYLDSFKHFLGFKSQPTPEDVAIANQLILSCIRERELEFECQKFGNIDRKDYKYVSPAVSNQCGKDLVDYAATKVLAAGFLLAVSMYGMAHYILWLASDIFPAILLSSTLVDFLSIAAFAVAVIYGISGIVKKLNEIENDKRVYQFDNEQLLKEYHRVQSKISQQTNELKYQMPLTPYDYKPKNEPLSAPISPIVKEKDLTWKDKLIAIIVFLAKGVGAGLEHPITKFFDRAMGGGYVTRVFLLLCTSPFLPSGFHMVAAVAVLSNPTTVAIIVASFLVWGAFRYYLDKVTEREKQIRQELAKEVTKKATIVHAIQLANIKLAAFNNASSALNLKLEEKNSSTPQSHPSRSQNLEPPSTRCCSFLNFIGFSDKKPISSLSAISSRKLSLPL